MDHLWQYSCRAKKEREGLVYIPKFAAYKRDCQRNRMKAREAEARYLAMRKGRCGLIGCEVFRIKKRNGSFNISPILNRLVRERPLFVLFFYSSQIQLQMMLLGG